MTQLDSIYLNNKLNVKDIDIHDIKEIPEIDINNIDKIDTTIIIDDENLDEILDEISLILEFENFIESIESVEYVETIMSKSHYILYNMSGTKLYLSKDEVFYESDKQENRQYYLISDNTPLFQDIETIYKYIKKNIWKFCLLNFIKIDFIKEYNKINDII